MRKNNKYLNCHTEEGRSPDVSISAESEYNKPRFPRKSFRFARNDKNMSTSPFLARKLARQSLTRFGHRICNACCASLYASLQANICVTCGKIAFSKQFYPRPLLARRGIVWILCCLFSFNAQAECTPTPDCASIGYTETSCEGDSLKCPFDITKMMCMPCDSSFRYDCSGDNITGGTGSACGGKYVSCECSDSEYTFTNGECVGPKCPVGYIYYSDKSCSAELDDTKTPIGVFVKGDALVISQIRSTSRYWSNAYTDTSLTNYSSSTDAKTDFNGKENTAVIVAAHSTETTSNNAAINCNSYSTEGTNAGDWYLPAAGELYNYVYGGGTNYNKINTTMTTLGWTFGSRYFWSSSEGSGSTAWYVYSSNGSVFLIDKGYSNSVSCFLAIN